MVDSMVNLLLETLRDVLVEEVKFLSGVSDEVKKVERDLRTIHRLLMDADRKRSDSPSLRECIIDLKELAMEAENVLETYAVEVKSKREGKSLKRKLQRFIGIAVHQAGNEIDGIRSRLAALTTTLQSLGGGEASFDAAHEEQRRFLRLRYAHEIEQHFVGMEKDIQGLVSMVKDDLRPVISICGMGGLGKTTLARKIYHDEDVKGRFKGRAWVCVTQQFQEETILRDIFKQLDSNRGGIDTMVYPRELVRELHSFLEHKKCLIVIDDIWEATHFATLKVAFPMNSKVMLTTRTQKITSQECDDYKLDFLSEDEGWELIRKIAFPNNAEATDATVLESISKPFEEMGRQIIQKCGCLPLAISVIGGILRQKQQSLTEWEKVSIHIDSYLKRGEGMQIDKQVEHILDLSYDVLPYYLKPCFLYLACFPKDREIEKEKLYRLWIAEGLISLEEKGNNDSLKVVAERYLTELAHRCMVQVQKDEFDLINEKFTSCKLHDLIRDLCSSKADEEKFMKCVDFSQHHHDISISIGSSFHRLGINFGRRDGLQSKSCVQEFEVLRAVLVLCKDSHSKRIINIGNIVNFESSKKLRIVVFEGIMFEDGKLPSTIGRLIHLRYLSLNGSNVDELPQYVCELPYLHTLNLRVWRDCTIKLPNLIWKMKRLRHLDLPNKLQVIGGDKLRLDGMNELETLDGINSETASIVDITNMTNLRELVVSIRQDMDILSKIVDYMSSNRCQLCWSRLSIEDCDLSGVEGRDIVKKMLMSHSLSRLHIVNCELQGSIPCYERGMCHNLTVLLIQHSKVGGDVHVVEEMGKYPVLTILGMDGEEHNEVSETEMRFGANSFQHLKKLFISGLLNIKKWEVENGSLPKLVDFYITNCFNNLEKLPDGLRFIPTLQILSCFGASEELMGRMAHGGLDYAKFSHIPKIVIR